MIQRKTTDCIIFHHALADRADVDTIRSWHLERGWDDIGYHFVISKNGKIEPGRTLDSVGAHALGRNENSIGVCLEGDFRKYQPTIHQLEACYRLYDCLCQVYCNELDIEFHRPLCDKNPCPGTRLNRYRFLALLRRGKIHG